MPIMWFNENYKELVATINEFNITLNKPTCNLISDAYNVMLGLDKEKGEVLIKALTKDEALRGDIPESHRYLITIRSSYARITNKEFIKQIKNQFNIASFSTPKKYKMEYREKDKMLVIYLAKEE